VDLDPHFPPGLVGVLLELPAHIESFTGIDEGQVFLPSLSYYGSNRHKMILEAFMLNDEGGIRYDNEGNH